MKSFIKILHSRLGPKSIFIFTLFGLIYASTAFALDFTFTWTANTESVDGYKLYYKLEDGNPPFDGTAATEGDSPVVIEGGDVTTFTIHGLLDNAIYYFALTAYKGSLESDYSKIVAIIPPPTITTTTVQIQ